MGLKKRMIQYSLCLCLAVIGGCTGVLTGTEPFRQLAGREQLLVDEPMNWVLVRNLSASITKHSEGYRLYLVPPEDLQRHLDPDPTGQSLPGIRAGGASIIISSVHEYGMETWHPVALGEITLPDGKVLPFEAEWRDGFPVQLRTPD